MRRAPAVFPSKIDERRLGVAEVTEADGDRVTRAEDGLAKPRVVRDDRVSGRGHTSATATELEVGADEGVERAERPVHGP